MKILVINSGSSSIKYKLFDMPKEFLISKGTIEHIGEKGSKFSDHYSGLKTILEEFDSVKAVGHRVVHGAEKFKKPAIVDSKVIKGIKECCAIAPLHNPANLSGILACQKLLPGVKQVVVFDTAFHQTIPAHAYIYGLPYEYYQKLKVRKYGFHGTSHEFVTAEASRILKKPLNKLKLISCHLGNGCSITAVDKGKSVDTSMGFTPLEGLVMGTRCGDVDPALVTHIMYKKNISAQEMERILNKESGLKGISGISNDMRSLEQEARKGNKRARLAIDIFIYRIRKYIGSYLSVLGGLDALIFTAGIGENQADVRDDICRGLFQYLGKKPRILVIPTNEELMIARQAYKLIVPRA
ncbi:MAG: acetate kinase [Candidatus Omnitrophica bacterium]|jgi:acetate kinase|nr:acetate kinase [Candidatus Omnitrophota bacterium]MDD5252890.1 acetate kinase [Candidatus Omnitrophota bacterium]